MKETYKRGAG